MTLVLTEKSRKLLTLMAASGYHHFEDLVLAKTCDSTCPAICMVEGCDNTNDLEKDQEEGWCETCGSNTMQSAFILGGVI